jgi:hypothetical protein
MMAEPDRPIDANKIHLPFTELLSGATGFICFEKRKAMEYSLSFFMDSPAFTS